MLHEKRYAWPAPRGANRTDSAVVTAQAEGDHLRAELGIGAGADQHEIDYEEDELVGEAKKRARGTRQAAAAIVVC